MTKPPAAPASAQSAWPGFSASSGDFRDPSAKPVFLRLRCHGRRTRHSAEPPARNPIKLLVMVAVIYGVAAAVPFLVVVMRVSSSHRIMGEYVNGNAAKILG